MPLLSLFVLFYLHLSLFFSTCYSTRPHLSSSLSPHVLSFSSSPSSFQNEENRYIFLHSGTINTKTEKDILKMKEKELEGIIQFLIHVEEVNTEYTEKITTQIEEWSGKIVDYIPRNTYHIICDLRCAYDLYSFSGVLFISPFLPFMKLSPFFSPSLSSRSLSSLSRSSSFPKASLLPHRDFGKLDISVSIVSSPSLLRKRNGKEETGDREYVNSVVRKWEIEYRERENKKRNIEERTIVTMNPISANKIQVSVFHFEDKIINEIAEWIAKQEETKWIEPKMNPTTNNLNSRANIQSGSIDVSSAWAWEHGLKGEGEVIGIGDSGLNTQHCFFFDPSSPVSFNSTNLNHRKVVSYWYFEDNTENKNGHGTHTAGSIAGTPADPSAPLSSYSGSAPEAKISFVDIAHADGTFFLPDDLNEFYSLTYESTARIHSDSWGTSVYPYYNNVAQQIDEFHYNHQDFLNIRSVGNEGDLGYGTLNAECTSKNSLCVGSSISSPLSFILGPYYTDYGRVIEGLDKFLCFQTRDAPLYNLTCDANNRTQLTTTNCCDNQYGLRSSCCQTYITSVMVERAEQFSIANYALLSSRGPTVDARVKPDVVVPGVNIFSSRSLLGQGDNYCSNTPYAEAPDTSAILVLSGTSQSTALLAGAAGLLRQYIREGYWKTGSKDISAGFNPSGAFLKAALINSAVYLNSSIYDSTNLKFVINTTDDRTYSPENTFSQGFGRVQLNQVMWFGDSDLNIFSSSNSSKDMELSANNFHTYCFKAQESRPFKATLVWTDPPAHPASFMSLVNDLDLLVYDDSSLMYGNGQISADGNMTSDGVNNVEQVTKTKINGTIQVYVLGSVVPKGPQSYSLFVSGKFETVVCPECYYDSNNIISRECNVSHGIGVSHCQPGGFFGKCKVTVCDSGYVERSLLDPDGCSATVSLTIYSAAIMFGIALISILCFMVLCSRVGHRRWQEFKPKKSKPTSVSNILLVAKLAQPESWLLITGTIASLVVVGLSLIVPLISADIFDLLYASGETTSRKSRINTSIAILAGVTVGIIIFEFIQNIILSLAGHRLVARLRIALFHNIVAQEMAFFDNRSTGEIMSRLATDVGYLRSILASSLPTIVSNTAQFCGGLAMMFIISWRLTLVVLAPVPFMTVMFKFYGAYVNKISLKMQDALADAASSAAETLFNIKTVRWLSGESREVNKFSLLIFGAFDISRRLAFVSGFYSAANGIASHIFTLILLTYGAYLVMDGSLSPSMLLAFNLFVPFVNDAVAALSGLYTSFQTSMGASTRFFELIERDSLIPTDEGNILVKSKGNISIKNVFFRYPGRPDALILNDISLDFVPGTITALVGPSGSGKTTILALIGRIYDPEGGKITLDGYDIKSLNTSSLHTHIGIVNQEPSLFSGTVFENVGYANDKASKEDIIEACKKAHAHEFVSTFPNGYDTDLGERGTQLSGGQKQRIAIARAILMNPTILLLDEATSELDVESEHLVQQALETLMKGKTVIIVAHRLSTVLAADVIAVIAEGGVKEKGTHEDLIAEKGIYYEFVERQWSKAGGVPDIIKRSNSLGETRTASQATIKQRKYLRAREMSLKMLPIQTNEEEDDTEGSQAGESSSDTRSHRSNSPMIKKKSSTSIIWKKAEPPKSTKDQKKLIEKSIRKIRKSTFSQPNRK